VCMLHQGGEVAVAPECRPLGNTRTFHEVGEAERCLGL
jgi:hypothetical protein